jgi:hypothetical protein
VAPRQRRTCWLQAHAGSKLARAAIALYVLLHHHPLTHPLSLLLLLLLLLLL